MVTYSYTLEWLQRWNLTPPEDVLRAMLYLEGRKRRFLVDFGTDNAIELALADWRARKTRPRRPIW